MQNNAGQLLSREDSVLVIIDIQEKLLPVMSNREKLLQNIVKLAHFARIANIPIILTEQEKLGATVTELRTELASYAPVIKLEFDACQCPEFIQAVKYSGRKNIIITGIESHICLTQTVLSLLPHYVVHVISDAASSRSPVDWDVAMERMRQAGAVISSTEMVIFELLQKAGTVEFKAALPLIK